MENIKKIIWILVLIVLFTCFAITMEILGNITEQAYISGYSKECSPQIEIDPLNPEYYIDDTFMVSGNTTLAEGDKIRVHFYRAAYIHGIKVRPNKTSIEVVTEVIPGKSGNNSWSAGINTTGFWPGENIVMAYSNKSWEINASRMVFLIYRDEV